MKSIISNKKTCFVCGCSYDIHKHHIYYGTANRRLSEKYGCWVYLCGKHHNLSNEGVHFNKNLDTKLKQFCQEKWEEKRTREEFMRVFGRNYL